MKWLKVTIGLLALAQVPVIAQDSRSTRPTPDPDGLRPRAMAGMRRRAAEKDAEQAILFMREHSPNRFRFFDALPEESSERYAIILLVSARWRAIEALKEDDPPLYETKLKQIHIEDDIYGMVASPQTPAQRESMRARLHESVRELLVLGLSERERRIEQLHRALKTEEEKLQNDRKQLDVMIERRANSLLTEGPAALRPGPGLGRWPGIAGSERPAPRGPATRPAPK
jgi:hypothetical protein